MRKIVGTGLILAFGMAPAGTGDRAREGASGRSAAKPRQERPPNRRGGKPGDPRASALAGLGCATSE